MSLIQGLRFLWIFGLVILVSGDYNTSEERNFIHNEEIVDTTTPQMDYTTEKISDTTIIITTTLSDENFILTSTIKPEEEYSKTLPSIDSNDFLSEISKTKKPKIFPDVVPMNSDASDNKQKLLQRTEFNISALPMCDESTTVEPEKIDDKSKLPFKPETIISARIKQDFEGWDVSDLGVKESTVSSLTVAWSPPNATIEVQYYVVQWFKNLQIVGSCKCLEDTLNYTITGLETCTNYGIHVTPYIEGALHKQRAVQETTTLQVDKTALNLKVSDNSSDWLKVSWNLPNTDCVVKYIITYCNSSLCTSADSNTTAYNATDLLPCTPYNFTVAVHGRSGEFGSVSLNASTNFLTPGIPAPAWTLAYRDSLEIFWTSPVGSTCVLEYEVVLTKPGKTSTERTKDNKIKIYDLGHCNTYRVKITPLHEYGKNESAVIDVSNTTFPDILTSPRCSFTPLLSKKNVKISWFIATNLDNNCEIAHIFATCNVTKVLGHGYNGTDGTTNVTIPIHTDNYHVVTTIDNLTPYTEYACRSFVNNSQGYSKESEPVIVTTQQDIPQPPILSQENISNTEFQLVWKPPEYIPGNLTNFEILIDCKYMFHQASWCKDCNCTAEPIKNIEGTEFSYHFNSAIPYTNYSIKIKAQTKAGWGDYSDILHFITLAGAPGPVSNLDFFINTNPYNSDVLDSYLTWGLPCFLHGKEIEYYNITAIGERKNYDTHYFTIIAENHYCNDNDTCIKQLSGDKSLREEFSYHFYVAARVREFYGLGEASIKTALYPAGIPPQPDENYTAQITIDPYIARKTTRTTSVLLPIFPDIAGTIRCYAIMVSRSNYLNFSYGRIDLLNGEWPFAATWAESKASEFKIAYQAAKICNNSYSSYIVDYGALKAVKFILGEDSEICPQLSSNRDERSFCNGPLEPNTWYDVRIRAFTNGGYQDSSIFTVKTDNDVKIGVVLVSIFGILGVGILVAMMVLIRKCSVQALLRRLMHSDMPGSPVPSPFNRRKFIIHCQQLADNPGKLSNEFQLLQTLSVDLQMPTNAACLQANRKKNRYTDILPYDFSRVKLLTIDNDPNSDYINASFINGFSGNHEYIACQGPKEETTYDFWRMIDEKDVKIIVMLTQLVENNKEKCHQYFPTIRETFTYENISIRCSMELDYRTYTQRTFVLQKEDNKKKTIVHLHFKDWPDHDVPEDFDLMINFCQIMRRHISASPGLAVIHCSAGIGRTGTLIAIDILLQQIKDNRKLDVFGTVYRLRHHRINMVQRESQYAYIYNCIRQVLKNPYFSKTYKPPSVDPIMENNANDKTKETSITNLVNSLETLRKSSLSTSVDSANQLFGSSSSSIPRTKSKSKICFSLKGLHGSKSTSAIYSKPSDNSIVRYNTLDGPVNEIDQNEESRSDTTSLNDTDYGSFRSLYENLIPRNRSRSSNMIGEDSSATENLLDTSL